MINKKKELFRKQKKYPNISVSYIITINLIKKILIKLYKIKFKILFL